MQAHLSNRCVYTEHLLWARQALSWGYRKDLDKVSTSNSAIVEERRQISKHACNTSGGNSTIKKKPLGKRTVMGGGQSGKASQRW